MNEHAKIGQPVEIGDAQARLAELVAAALRGENVVLAEAGAPRVRLVPIAASDASDLREIGERRRSAMGIWRDAFTGYDTRITALKADNADPDERFRRKFGLPD
jgi:prevent-host-death family protein